MVKNPRHFYEIMGSEGEKRPASSLTPKPHLTPPPQNIPLPSEVAPVQNTITLRKETFFAGIAFFIVLIVISFIVGRSTASSVVTVPKQKETKPETTDLQPPSLIKDEKYLIVAITLPASRLNEAQEIKDWLVKGGWINAELRKEGENINVVLGGYRTKKLVEEALNNIKNTVYNNKKIFADAKLLEK